MTRAIFHFVILSLSLTATNIFAQQIKSQKPPLELTVRIVSQDYCTVNENSSALELKQKLRYHNARKQKLILYNGHDLFYQSKILTAPGNLAGPYGVWLVNSRYFDEEPEAIDQASPGRVFLTLAPGKNYEREIVIGAGVVDEHVERGDSSIRAGDHTLQLIVSTWYKAPALAFKLRQQWQSKGFLWASPLVSTPVHFVAQRPGLASPCRSGN
jgi:hypothetical protein